MRRIFIQHSANRTFFAGPKAWVSDPVRGLLFATPLNAIAYVVQHQMEGVQVVVVGEAEEEPVIVRVPREKERQPA